MKYRVGDRVVCTGAVLWDSEVVQGTQGTITAYEWDHYGRNDNYVWVEWDQIGMRVYRRPDVAFDILEDPCDWSELELQ